MPINSLLYPSNVFVPTTFDVDNSVRMDGSSKFTRSFGSAGNRKKWTMSMWVKRGALSADQKLMGKYTSSSDRFALLFNGSDQLQIFWGNDGGNKQITTNRLFRDTSAFYNFTFIIDTGNSTAADRMQIWVNGVRETSFASTAYPTSGQDLPWNDSGVNEIGSYNNGNKFNGYLAEVVFQNDNAATPVDKFISFDEDSGICVPIDVSGLTLGTNGFYLDFEDSSALGNDASGSNNFTSAGLAAIDQSTDTCTNNFATLNPLALGNNPNAYYAALSEGNLKLKGNATTNNGNAFSTMAFNSGKWYCEVKMVDVDNSLFPIVGVITEAEIVSANSPSNSGQIGTTIAGTVGYSPDGQKIVAGTESSYGNTFTNNDIIGIAIDCDNGAVYFSKNGTFQASGNPTSGSSRTNAAVTFTPSTNYFFGASVYKDTNDIDFNFGSPPFAISSGNQDGNSYGNFEYAVPSGYFSLNTKNLAEYG